MNYENLLSPIKIRNLELRNRTIFPGMATKMIAEYGYVTQMLIDYHVARAAGGCALNFTEAASVHTPSAPRNFLSIHDDKFLPGLKRLTDAVHAAGGKIGVQMWQGGFVATQMDPEAIGVYPDDFEPLKIKAASVELLQECVKAFGEAAARSVEAGFDCLEFHCAHNYSPHSFLSPALNHRTDEYGGSFEKCMRYPLECIDSIRANMPKDMPLFIRVSAVDDYLPNGITIDMMIEFLNRAQEKGVDVADVSRGNVVTPAIDYEVPSINNPRGFNVPNAAKIKKGTGLVTIAVGRINDPDQAEEIIASGHADMVALGRAQIGDPEFVNKVRDGRPDDITRCVACNQGCYDLYMNPAYPHISCLQNPTVGCEAEYTITPVQSPKTVLVAGMGMAGMEAAARLKARGHNPILCEESDALGGQFILAGCAPRKAEMAEAALARGRQLERQGVDIRLNTKVDALLIDELFPDAVIVSTGASPIVLRLPGADNSNVIDTVTVLEGNSTLSGKVAIIGGGLVGLEVAEYLAEKDERVNDITVIEMLDAVGKDLGPSRINGVMGNLKKHEVEFCVNCTCLEIQPDAVIVECEGTQKRIPCDGVVVAVGAVSRDNSEIVSACEKKNIPYYIVGDAKKPRRAIDAVAEAACVANSL